MSGFEVAKRLAEDGQRLRFYQDFYGRQWIKVQGGWRFWRTRKIFLDNEEIVELKHLIARRRRGGGSASSGASVSSAGD